MALDDSLLFSFLTPEISSSLDHPETCINLSNGQFEHSLHCGVNPGQDLLIILSVAAASIAGHSDNTCLFIRWAFIPHPLLILGRFCYIHTDGTTECYHNLCIRKGHIHWNNDVIPKGQNCDILRGALTSV
ncbi:hypothetical protein BsWGS_02485 [Bradybaena similaris]